MLAFIERQVVDQKERSDFRKIKSAQRLFTCAGVKRVLRASDAVAAATGGEDFASVVQGLAPGKGSGTAKAVPFPHTQFTLQTVVIRERAVDTVADIAVSAAGATSGEAGLRRVDARRNSSRNEVAETVGYQAVECGVGVDCLEVANYVIAHVANLQDHP